MGQANKHWEQGFWDESHIEKDKYVCNDHIDDDAICAFVIEYSEEGICSYCGYKSQVTLVNEVIEFIKGGVFYFYGDANDEGVNYESEEGGYYGAVTYDTEEMLEDAGLEVNSDILRKEIIHAFGYNIWCKIDPYADRENVEMAYNWEEFKQVVKHKSRYVFLGSKQFQTGNQNLPVDEVLNDIGRRVDDLNLLVRIRNCPSSLPST